MDQYEPTQPKLPSFRGEQTQPMTPPEPPPLPPLPLEIPPSYESTHHSQGTPAYMPPPAQPRRPSRRRRVRRSGKRGLACGPSCLIGCFGVIAVTIITMLVSTWLVYSTYSARLDERLDEFDDRLAQKNFETSFIYDRQGRELYQVIGQGRRERISIDEIPDVVKYATISLEDDSFYTNPGVDLTSILRATRDYFRQGEVVSGASTITQQLVREVLFEEDYRYERTIRRKADEAILALVLTQRMEKDEILELYLNEINYGNLAYGIEAAAQVYFGKSAQNLELHEAALLAGLPQAPYILNPLNPDPDVQKMVTDRQHLVLDLMVDEGYITQAQADEAKLKPLVYSSPEVPLDKAPHFVVYAQDELIALFKSQYEAQGYLSEDAEKLAEQLLYEGGLRIYTTLDLDLQAIAENAARTTVSTIGPQHNLTNASVVAIQPITGEILAMVGSVDFNNEAIDGQVNVALAKRQPGSTMKPFTYSAAMEQLGWVPASVIWDTNISIGIPGQPTYEPVNYDRVQHGPVHVRDALANSYNIPAVQTLRAVGVQNLINFMHRFGVTSLDRPATDYGLSLTLGGGDITLIELTNAYGNFARGGYYVPPTGILCIINSKGEILYEYENGCVGGQETGNTRSMNAVNLQRPVLDPRIAYAISDILSDNAARTPAMGSNSPLNTGSLLTSVKTGTTDDFRDNWTVGYTANLVVGVWSGNSNNDPMINISGLQGAAPIWRDTIITMHNSGLIEMNHQLNVPPNMSLQRMCNVRNLRDPATDCSSFRQEWFFDSAILAPNDRGEMVPVAQPFSEEQPSSEFGPQLLELQPDIFQTYVRPLTPDQVNFFVSVNPGSYPQKYCLVPIEVLGSVPDAQLLIFAQAPSDPEDAKRAYQYALSPNINYAILPQFACTPETIVGGFPSLDTPAGDWEVNPTSSHPQRTAAIYCKVGGIIEVWGIENSVGFPAFSVTPQEIAAVGIPPQNTLIKEGSGNIRLYRLSSGQFQVNAPLGADPNGYVVIWDGC